MAYPLQSPGVDVTVIDEGFYATSGQGTVPLLIIGTHKYKNQPGGNSLALGTLPENANLLYKITSQRELTQTFGNPIFYSKEGTPEDGYELNEYGLHAAYQFLALSNLAYVVNSSVDYAQLRPSVTEPVSKPAGGTFWLNTATTAWGIFQSNGSPQLGNAWVKQTPLLLSKTSQLVYSIIGNFRSTSGVSDPTLPLTTTAGHLVINGTSVTIPSGTRMLGDATHDGVANLINSTLGSLGELNSAYVIGINGKAYIMLVDAANSGRLDLTGSDGQTLIDLGLTTGLDSITNNPVIVGPSLIPSLNIGSAGNFAINTIYNNNVVFQKLTSFYTVGGSLVPAISMWYPVGSSLWTSASPNSNKFTFAPHYQIPANSKNGDVWINTTPFSKGANPVVQVYNANTGAWVSVVTPLYANDAAAVAGIGPLYLTPNATIYMQYGTTVTTGSGTNTIASHTLLIWNGAGWDSLVYQAQNTPPTAKPQDGTLWYHNDFQVDVMVSTGQVWNGYRRIYPNTDPLGVILDATMPMFQSDNTPLVDNDLWINTSLSAMENYPQLYRYIVATKSWQLVDKTDNVTPFGIIFQDARWNIDGSEFGTQEPKLMVNSNFVDPDAPDPLLYPQGTLLFNTRFSSQNVKEWQSTQLDGLYQGTNYTTDTYFVGPENLPVAHFPPVSYAGRWVTASGNDGNVPYMGRKAQRHMVVKSLKASIAGNEELLSETVYFTLLATPGYCELLNDMVELNDSKKQTAFIVGDTPVRLDPSGTSLINWATNKNNVKLDGDDGIVTASEYLGVYYPWGLGTNTDGSSIVIPPSTMALRTIVKSDNMSYVWYTPAGYTRGLVDNASSVGYINSKTGFYKPIIMNPGQRDILYQNNINAICFMPSRGLVIMGDKTRDPVNNSQTRINVARLVNFLRYNLDNIAKPFLFEPNIQHTQDSAKTVMERFLSGLVSLNAMYDFIVVCDSSNNTAQRVNNNELWIDIAIQPVKTIDFIYIPLRLESKGTNLSALYSGLQGKIQ